MMCLLICFHDIKLWEVIEVLGDKVGVPIKVLVKRAGDKLVTLTVIPEEANLDV